MHRRDFLTGGLLVLGAIATGGCKGFEAAEHRYKLAPEHILPPDIAKAPAEVREAYRFAIANRGHSPLHPLLPDGSLPSQFLSS